MTIPVSSGYVCYQRVVWNLFAKIHKLRLSLGAGDELPKRPITLRHNTELVAFGIIQLVLENVSDCSSLWCAKVLTKL